MVYLVGLLLLVALTASLTRLVTTDEITAEWRTRIINGKKTPYMVAKALDCDRCTAFWISALIINPAALAIAASLHVLPGWAAAIAWIPSAFSTSYLAFLLIIRGEA